MSPMPAASVGSVGVCPRGVVHQQIPAFAAAPSVYQQRAYFQAFGRPRPTRANTSARQEHAGRVIFNLGDKIREDLLNLNVNEH